MMKNNEVSSATAPVYSAGNAAENIPTIVRCECGRNVVLWDARSECVCGTIFSTDCNDLG
jgi:hypothetical protein